MKIFEFIKEFVRKFVNCLCCKKKYESGYYYRFEYDSNLFYR